MEIEMKRTDVFSILVKATGRLDLDNAVEYGGKIKEVIEDIDDIKNLVLDFRGITFISSFGLKVLLELYKDMSTRGSMKLVNVPEEIVKSIKMVGFDKFLAID